jgi:hypothetical protein
MILKFIFLLQFFVISDTNTVVNCSSIPEGIILTVGIFLNPNDINLCVNYGKPDDSYYHTNYIHAKSIETYSIDINTKKEKLETYSAYSKDNKLILFKNPCFYGDSGFVKFEYDLIGNRILEESPRHLAKFEYDENSNIVKRTINYKSSSNKCTISEYKHEGLLETFKTYDLNSEDTSNYFREFNEDKLLIRNGYFLSTIVENYFYNETGLLISSSVGSSEISGTKYRYNNCGLVTSSLSFNDTGEVVHEIIYNYEFFRDKQNHIIMRIKG